jgi:hypothetical protein
MSTKCLNPACSSRANSSFNTLPACYSCVTSFYSTGRFCPGCLEGFPSAPDDAIKCTGCMKVTHRKCAGVVPPISITDRFLITDFRCTECRTGSDSVQFHFLRDAAAGAVLAATSKGSLYPCFYVGIDPAEPAQPVTTICRDTGGKWVRWQIKPSAVKQVVTTPYTQEFLQTNKLYKESGRDWLVFGEMEMRISGDAFKMFEIATRYISEGGSESEAPDLVEEEPRKKKNRLDLCPLRPPIDPLELDYVPTPSTEAPAVEPQVRTVEPLEVVWAKVAGAKPAWAPAVLGFIYPQSTSPTPFFVWFLEGVDADTSPPPPPQTDGPSWYLASLETKCIKPRGVKCAYLTWQNVKPFDGPHREGYLKGIAATNNGTRKKQLMDAVVLGDSIRAGLTPIPDFILRDQKGKQNVLDHEQYAAKQLDVVVLPGVKLENVKLYIECNMLQLHWRCITRAFEFVRVIQDEVFGGWHLIAAKDWPTDKEVDAGVQDVLLVYPGQVLTEAEALVLEESCKSGIHDDRNRYVAEIPNTAQILDRGNNVNLNGTGKNLFVDGFKFADPGTSIWAPGPTVNHERMEYCKLEPRHSLSNDIRGFWLQRKRGEIITRDEPLFWSYDCGAGKFDQDFGLVGKEPPVGWVSTAQVLADRGMKVKQVSSVDESSG